MKINYVLTGYVKFWIATSSVMFLNRNLEENLGMLTTRCLFFLFFFVIGLLSYCSLPHNFNLYFSSILNETSQYVISIHIENLHIKIEWFFKQLPHFLSDICWHVPLQIVYPHYKYSTLGHSGQITACDSVSYLQKQRLI